MNGLVMAVQLPALLLGLFGGYVSFTSKGGSEGGVPVLAFVIAAFMASAIGSMIQYAASLVGHAPVGDVAFGLPLVQAALAFGAVVVGERLSRSRGERGR